MKIQDSQEPDQIDIRHLKFLYVPTHQIRINQGPWAVRQHARVRQGLLLPRRLPDEPRQEVRGLVEGGRKGQEEKRRWIHIREKSHNCETPSYSVPKGIVHTMGRLQLIFYGKSHCGILATPPAVSFNPPIFQSSLGMINAYRKIRHIAQYSLLTKSQAKRKYFLSTKPSAQPVGPPCKAPLEIDATKDASASNFCGRGIAGGIIQTRLLYSKITKLFCSLPYCERKDKCFVEN